MSAKKITADYVMLVNKGRKHIMSVTAYEKDKDIISAAGWKVASTDQYAKKHNIEFESQPKDTAEEYNTDSWSSHEVSYENKKRGRKKKTDAEEEYNEDIDIN